MDKRTQYTVERNPSPFVTCGHLLTACRIAKRYTHRHPTVDELRRDFGMSRATAFRWLSALRQA